MRPPVGKARGREGFTLLELQVGIILLLFAVTGLAAIMGNYLKQLEQMEQNHALFACLSPDQKRIIFTESLSGGPSQRLYQIQVQGIQSAGTTLQARVTLNALH